MVQLPGLAEQGYRMPDAGKNQLTQMLSIAPPHAHHMRSLGEFMYNRSVSLATARSMKHPPRHPRSLVSLLCHEVINPKGSLNSCSLSRNLWFALFSPLPAYPPKVLPHSVVIDLGD